MTWLCRLFGHWYKRGKTFQGTDYVADYAQCRVCGQFTEAVRPGWQYGGTYS